MCRTHYQRWWRSQPENKEKPKQYERRYYWQKPEKHKKPPQKRKKGSRYPNVKQWRRRNPDLWRWQKRRYYKKYAQDPPNSGQPYDDFDDAMILDKVILDEKGNILKSNVKDRELAHFLGRSLAAIQAHRCALKKRFIKSRPKV